MILRTIQQTVLLIIGITGTVGCSPFYQLNSGIQPESEGSFRLLVEPVTSEVRTVEPLALVRSQGKTSGRQIFNLDYATQLEVFKSPEMLTKIYNKVKLKYPNISYFSVEKGLSVQRVVDPTYPQPTKIVEVRYAAKDPEQVKFVLKIVSDEFLKYHLTELKNCINQDADFMDTKLRNELKP